MTFNLSTTLGRSSKENALTTTSYFAYERNKTIEICSGAKTKKYYSKKKTHTDSEAGKNCLK